MSEAYGGGLQALDEGCARWEAAVADLLEGTISLEEEQALRGHAAGCAHCESLLRDAGQGREWVRMLHDAPLPVPEELLGRILAKTAVIGAPQMDGAFSDTGAHALLLPHPAFLTHGHREARVLMTAATAFFSIALTLSLAGVRMADVNAAIHSPSSLGVSASRQFFDAKKQAVSFYDNLRVVREVEATVEDLRQRERDKNKDAQPLHPSALHTYESTGTGTLTAVVLPAVADRRDTL